MTRAHPVPRQSGAALLMAMLTVALVATFAATALWQQWRAVEVEAAERARAQSAWVLVGALDWGRLILRQDAMPGAGNTGGLNVDHLGEPWAVPLQETRMSTFLAADKGVAQGETVELPDVFLSGRIVDLQSRLNVANLVENGAPVPATQLAFVRLFARLNVPPIELDRLIKGLLLARPPVAAAGSGAAAPASAQARIQAQATSYSPLLPQRFDQLTWLGLSPETLLALAPHVTVLDSITPINLNTASAEVLVAAVPGADLAGVQRLLERRARIPLRSIGEATTLLGLETPLNGRDFGVNSSYFEVQGRLRVEGSVVHERSLVRRSSTNVVTLWRERTAGELLP